VSRQQHALRELISANLSSTQNKSSVPLDDNNDKNVVDEDYYAHSNAPDNSQELNDGQSGGLLSLFGRRRRRSRCSLSSTVLLRRRCSGALLHDKNIVARRRRGCES
jgi:hypothetical protein